MLRAGITGGIGSGKSTVCRIFSALGIPVFYADEEAKKLMQKDDALKQSIIFLFGPEAYRNGAPDNAYISSIAFTQPQKLAALNALVHPAAIKAAAAWFGVQEHFAAPYAIKEAAVFFESGSDKFVDIMIGVSAPEPLRIARAMQRSGMAESDVRSRIARQMNEEEKMARCDFVITNDGVQAVLPQVLQIHQELIEKLR